MSLNLLAPERSPAAGVVEASSHSRQVTAPRILLYSHDTFGLGNISRTLLLADSLRERYPGAAVLIVTGSPVIHAFRIPEGVDYVKLPCVDRVAADTYEPRYLASWADEVHSTRRAILQQIVRGFSPDLMIVDKRPGGIDGELVDALDLLRGADRRTRLVLGMRDILDAPERSRLSLERSGSFTIINRYYDEVWIYGEQGIFDPIREYCFPRSVAEKTVFCGYLQRPVAASRVEGGPPRVLVTTGGGGDGSTLITSYLEGLVNLPRRLALQSTVVFGPQMSSASRDEILERFGYLADVEFLDFEPDLTQRYAQADVVVSKAGYNTVCELLSFGKRAVLVPRAEPVMEQLIRARLFAERGYFELVEPAALDPHALVARVLALLARDPSAGPRCRLDGLPRIGERVAHLLEARAV